MRVLAAALVAGSCTMLSACGAVTHAAPAAGAATVTATVPALAPPPARPVAPAACQTAAAAELTTIARRIYHQAVAGRNVAEARRRLTRAPGLAVAAAAGSPRAARLALAPLVKGQLVRADVRDGRGRVLASVGRKSAFAPVRVALRVGGRRVGEVSFTVTDDHAYTAITRRLTGAHVLFHRGHHRVMGSLRALPAPLPARGTVRVGAVRYRVATIRASAYPRGPLSISLLLPPAPSGVCGSSAADTRLRTVGAVGRRLYAQETASPAVRRVVRIVGADPAFRAAAAAQDRTALRAAVIGFFRNHSLHVVRVRLTQGTRLVYDLGGPYALAPVGGAIAGPDGRPAGTFALAVQDDTGYIKLMHRFTGAAVQLRSAGRAVPGSTLAPGPAGLPGHGTVRWAGRTYGVDSFTATAFPAGPLRISLLLRQAG